MAKGLNEVKLIGNCGGDPEVRALPNGDAVANVTLATSESWKDKQTGQTQTRTEWHRVSFFGRLAEIVGQYVTKGSRIYVQGKLQTREWEKDGVKRYTTEIVVGMGGNLILLDGPPAQGQGQQQQRQAPQQQRQAPVQHQAPQPDYDSFDDDIPF